MNLITVKKRQDKRAALALAVVKVGNGGRAFVVETAQGEPIVITAAHCGAADGRHLPPLL